MSINKPNLREETMKINKSIIYAALFALTMTGATTNAQTLIEGAKDAAVGVAGAASTVVDGAKKVVEPVTKPIAEAAAPVTDAVKPVTDIVTGSPQPERVKEQLAKPIDCKHAQRDIAVLEEEKASLLKRTVSGVKSVTPAGAAIGLLAGHYQEGVEVAVGNYNADIEARIEAIRQKCKI